MFIANWKMNGSKEMVCKWIEAISSDIPDNIQSKCVFCPPVCFLSIAYELIKKKKLKVILGAQDIDPNTKESLTGGISGSMLKELGCQYVIIGHSERRLKYQEEDLLLFEKMVAASSSNIKVILCIGESLEEREAGKTFKVLKQQLEIVFKAEKAKIIVAYEPVWAIGSGKTAELEYISEVHNKIREEFNSVTTNQLLGVIYGGSIDVNSSENIFHLDNVDGLLIGAASLEGREFGNIAVNSVQSV